MNQSESIITKVPESGAGVFASARGWRSATNPWLAWAHVVWVASAALGLLIFLIALPRGYALRFSGAAFDFAIDAPGWYISIASVAQGFASILTATVSLALAGILFWKKRDDPMALFVSLYLLAYGVLLGGPLEALNGFAPLVPGASTQPGMLVSPELITEIQTVLLTVPGLYLFYLFPNGRFVPGWTRYAALLALLMTPALAWIFAREWTSPMMPLVAWSIVAAFFVLMVAGVYAQIYRYRRVASPVERQQTKWVVFGLILNLIVTLLLQPSYFAVSQLPPGALHPWWEPLSALGWWVSLTIVPLSLAIAVMRFRLWDIDLIVNRALVFTLLSGSVVAIYVLSVVLLGALFHTSGNFIVSLIATALVAVFFQPLRDRLQRGVNRLIYGERDDPYAVLSRLGERLEAVLAPEAILPTIVETVAQALKVPFVAIALKQDDAFRTVAAYGRAADEPLVLPLNHQSEMIGQLILARRSPGEEFSSADWQLLENIAREAGVAAHAVRLTVDLQRSRERLVTAREEERRRIRRDLHDGLGPALASLAMQADNAREWTRTDPARVDAALVDITTKTQAALSDIRRLVYDLRPPALDELGLVGALRQSVANVPNGLHVEIDTPDSLPPLSAAVEVAAYRIAQEALNNVVLHSHARNCMVRFSVADTLELEICDDGVGLPPDVRAGVGLISIRERASEVGGNCSIESCDGKGTRVIARLPPATL